MLGLAASLAKGGASLLTYVKDNLKLYLDFKKSRSDTLAFPSEGSTYFITDDYIAVPDNDAFDFNESDVSITAWIKPTDLSTNYTILDKRVTDHKGITLEVNGGQNSPFFQISDGTNDYYAYFDDDLVAGAWNHIAISFKVAGTGDATFYLNGVDAGRTYQALANVGDTSNTAEIRIGKASDGYTAYPFKGSIANLAVWSRALSQEEVQSVMNKSYSQLGSVEKTSLVSWWALDSASNGVVQPHDGETLGSNLVDANTSSGWFDNSDSSTITNITDGVSVADDSGFSDIGYFRDSSILSTDLTVGKLYKVQVDAYHNGVSTIELRIRDGSANQLINLTTTNTTYTRYIVAQSATGGSIRTNNHASGSIAYLTNLSVKEVTSNTGFITGATTTTSVYGNNSPVLPRAIDIAESQAEQIGDGSAYFNGGTSTDKIVVPYNANFAGGTNALTVACWVKNDSTITNWGGFVDMHFSYNFRLGRSSSTDTVVWKIDDETNESELAGGTFKDENWHHVVGTVNGANMYIYLNGVRVATKTNNSAKVGGGSNQASSDLWIGRNNNWTTEAFGGNIAGVGIWQGALSQSQVQSLMESTSYAKIPADVKSTLGSEEITSLTNFSGGIESFSSSSNTMTASNTSGTSYVVSNELGASTGKVYKVNISKDSIVGTIQVFMANSSGTIDSDHASFPSSTVTLTSNSSDVYYVTFADVDYDYLWFSFSGGTSTITNATISVKEVTCDLVAYYPLDADSSNTSNGVGITNDSVNGETLGNDIASSLTWVNSSSSPYETFVTNGNNITNAVNTSWGIAYTSNFSLTSAKLYKISFDMDISSGSIDHVRIAIGTGIDTPTGLDEVPTNGTNTFYFIGDSTRTDFKFGFRGNDAVAFSLSNLSIKEVTSNTGVLK